MRVASRSQRFRALHRNLVTADRANQYKLRSIAHHNRRAAVESTHPPSPIAPASKRTFDNFSRKPLTQISMCRRTFAIEAASGR